MQSSCLSIAYHNTANVLQYTTTTQAINDNYPILLAYLPTINTYRQQHCTNNSKQVHTVPDMAFLNGIKPAERVPCHKAKIRSPLSNNKYVYCIVTNLILKGYSGVAQTLAPH